MIRLYLLLISVFVIAMPGFAMAKNRANSIEQLVGEVMQAYQVPGVAIGIVEHGKVIYAKGFGQADLTTGRRVDKHTLFKIASNSKAFTSAALAILVDQQKLRWDDKVIDYLPNFKMADPWVTQAFNIRDLLTHRSGLGLGAGDLMLWPETTRFTREDVVHNLRYLKPVSSFRDAYAYDNLMYIVAGEVVAKIAGKSWEDFIEASIFKPLTMQNCAAGGVDLAKNSNLAAPHALLDGQLQVLSANKISGKSSLMAAAGGIKCSVSDLLKWVNFFLQKSVSNTTQDFSFNKIKAILSAKQKRILQAPVTPLPISTRLKALNQTRYRAYALGWRVSNFFGYHLVSHTGSLAGFMSRIMMLPQKNLGIVILTNQQSSEARRALGYGLLQILTHPKQQRSGSDWFLSFNKIINDLKDKSPRLTNRKNINSERQAKALPIPISKENEKKLGDYLDRWFGKVSLERQGSEVVFSSNMSPRMRGKVYYFSKDCWWIKWDDRSFEADAWIFFEKASSQQPVTFRMQAISSQTDFSFDFDDLNFSKTSATN